ncbi:hypothetical protein SNE40_009824 [Patella caerulea]|uniref:Uncharacterized protein n=1 Tax=Patella caerulea TaxID=87958 RepID=A0AAN8JWI1_PATCE
MAGRRPRKKQSKCTQVCGENFNGRSCAKITLAKIYNVNRPDKFIHGYIVHDDQSNQTLGKSQFFDFMNIPQNQSQSYKLSLCSGTQTMTGIIAPGFIIESLDSTTQMQLPAVIECNDIPDNRSTRWRRVRRRENCSSKMFVKHPV